MLKHIGYTDMKLKLFSIVSLIIFLLCVGSIFSLAQSNCITLNQLIHKYYKSENPQLTILAKNFKVKHLTYQNGLAAYRISSKIDLSVPYSKSIESVLQPDGNSIYTQREYLSPIYTFTTFKKIPLTGGTIGVSSIVGYFQNFIDNSQQFNANWYNIYINQPFWAFNEYRYDKKLKKLTLCADSVQYYKDKEAKLEEFITKAIDYEILKLRIKNIELDISNNQNAIEKVKLLFENGKALSIDTLILSNNIEQLYLQKEQLKKEQTIKKADLDHSLNQQYDFAICNLDELTPYSIDSALLFERYLQYNNQSELLINAFVIAENIKRANLAHGVVSSISIGNGINQTATTFNPLFNNPAQKQNISLALTVPLTGWQTYKRNKEISQLQRQAFEMNKAELIFLAGEWTIQQLSNYLFLFKFYQFYKDRLIGLEEVNKVTLIKMLSGRTSANEYFVTQLSINATKLELLNITKQIQLFRFQLRVKTLYDFELMESVF